MTTATSYTLTIGGSPAPSAVLGAIKQIEVEDHASMADMMRLRIAVAVREDGDGWTVLDDELFTRLANLRITVTVGTGRAMPLLDAYVIDVDTTFSEQPGTSELVVTAMDPTVLMHLEEKVKAWPNMTDSDVASSIFSDSAYGFSPVVETTSLSRQEDDHTLVQRGSDIAFLQQLADRNGYECFVALNDAGVVEGHFHPPKPDEQPQGTLSVNLGPATNVNQFRARFDMLGPAVAKAATIDPDDASSQSGDANEPGQASGMGGEPATPRDRPRTVLLSQLGMAQAGEVQQLRAGRGGPLELVDRRRGRAQHGRLRQGPEGEAAGDGPRRGPAVQRPLLRGARAAHDRRRRHLDAALHAAPQRDGPHPARELPERRCAGVLILSGARPEVADDPRAPRARWRARLP